MRPLRMTAEQAIRLSLAEQHDWFRRTTRRHPSAGAGPESAATSTSCLVAGRPTPAIGSRSALARGPELISREAGPLSGRRRPPSGRHIAFGTDPATQMSVSWQVSGPVAEPFVRIGEARTELGGRVPAEIRVLTTPAGVITPLGRTTPVAGARVEQYYLHAELSGLEPGRSYYYSVGHRGWDGSGEPGALGMFTTAPNGRVPFTFTAFGDHGVTADAAGVTNLIRAQNPVFHLHAGDISYAEAGGRGLITDAYDPREWDHFLAQIEPAAASIPWQVAVGNHELEAWYSADGYGGQRARFGFPTPGAANGRAGADAAVGTTPPPVYYSFSYGNVGVLSLDANDVSYEIVANHGYAQGAQTAWLDSTLAAFRSDPEIDFVVAYFHHCAYCTCSSHGSDGGVREHWTPLFDKYAVDLVINGHNHIYERTDPIRGGSATGPAPAGATVYPASSGTTYIVAGAAGKSLYEFPVGDSYQGAARCAGSIASQVHQPGGRAEAESVTWSRVRYTGYCLLVVESDPGWRAGAPSVLRIRAVSADGAEVDRIDLVR